MRTTRDKTVAKGSDVGIVNSVEGAIFAKTIMAARSGGNKRTFRLTDYRERYLIFQRHQHVYLCLPCQLATEKSDN